MGQYFLYANLDKREYFEIDALGGASKTDGVGRGGGARALGLLLLAGASTVPGVGSWRGDRVATIGDYFPPGHLPPDDVSPGRPPEVFPYAHVREHFRDIRSQVAVMLVEHDGPDELVEVAGRSDEVFVLLAELALHHGVPGIAEAVQRAFGDSWRKRYAEKRATTVLRTDAPTRPAEAG